MPLRPQTMRQAQANEDSAKPASDADEGKEG